MRDATLRLSLFGITLLAMQLSPCQGLCSLVNGTEARCHDLSDIKYIDTYDLESLKTSVSENILAPSNILRNLHSLRHLRLTRGHLQRIESGTFRQLQELRSLDLSENEMKSLEPTSFDGLKKLRNLNLRKNNFERIPEAVLKLKNLKVIDVAGNPLICDCQTVRMRDELLERGVHLLKRILCSQPATAKGKQLVDLKTDVVCMFEEQDKEMQMDDPNAATSGEISSDDPVDDETPSEYDEDDTEATTVDVAVTAAPEVVETPASAEVSGEDDSILTNAEPTTVHPSGLSTTEATVKRSTGAEDELVIPEESDERASTLPVPASTTEIAESTDEKPVRKRPEIPIEGSGEEDDLGEGSGIEGSGTGVPPIIWSIPHEEETEPESKSPTKGGGFLETLGWDGIGGASAAPEDDPTKDLNLQEEEFISASTDPTSSSSSKSSMDDRLIVPVHVGKSGGAAGKDVDVMANGDGTVEVGRALGESKSGRVQAVETGEATDASPARQPQKGMGSYVVLAILLCILGTLIGFAAYKGEFCASKRKRSDVEGGTELKDMTKSLLDAGNGAQPKIASNGNLENVPLVFTAPSDGSKTQYTAIPDVVDPVKPGRKSFASHEDPDKGLANGRSHQDLVDPSDGCAKSRGPGEPTRNGKHHRDSVSSIGTDSRGSPSARISPPGIMATNGSLVNLPGLAPPPLSPGAQRVKITLQDNPDSVPKTPILITRTKTGDNLVKTP